MSNVPYQIFENVVGDSKTKEADNINGQNSCKPTKDKPKLSERTKVNICTCILTLFIGLIFIVPKTAVECVTY